MKIKHISILLIIFFQYVPAEETAFPKLTLQQAAAIALEKNPEMLLAIKELETVHARKLQLSAIPDLEVVTEWDNLPGKSIFAEPADRKTGVFQALEFPGKRGMKKSIGLFEEEIAKEKVERMKQLVISEVHKKYYNILLQEKIKSEYELILDLLKQLLESSNTKYQADLGQYIEVVRAKIELTKFKNELVEINKELASTKRELNYIIGRKTGDESWTPLPEAPVKFMTEDPDEIREKLLKMNHTLKIMKLYLEKSKKNAGLARLGLLPDYGVGIYQNTAGNINNWAGEFKINLPLYFWWKQEGEIKETLAEKGSAEIKLAAAENNIFRIIEDIFSLVQAREEQLRNYEQILLPEIEDGLKTALNSYQAGKIDSLELLDIYRTYKTVKIEYAKTLYGYLSARAELMAAGEEKE